MRVDITSLRAEIAKNLNKIKELEQEAMHGSREAAEEITYLRMDVHFAEEEMREIVNYVSVVG